MTSSQIGKTEVLNNVLAYYIDQDPSPIMVVVPTLELALALSKDRLAPMFRDTERLRGKVSDVKSKTTSNTLLHKSFAGGQITIAGANSPSSLASRPIRIVLLDEVDRYPSSVGTEGDPVKLAEKRSITFWNRKKIRTSTPTIAGISRIEALYHDSDRRRYFVPCPSCRAYILLRFNRRPETEHMAEALLKFEKTDLSTIRFVCPYCQTSIDESKKNRLVRDGRWIAELPDRKTHAGFHIWEAYSPWSTWRKIVSEFLEAKRSPETLKVWVNTTLGETWEEEESFSIDPTKLEGRVEDFEDIPAAVLILTAGVDVQENRLEVLVQGWGAGEETWTIDRRELYGSPSSSTVWEQLDDYLLRKWKTETGIELGISGVFVDSGYLTSHVYGWTRQRSRRGIYASKGFAGPNRPLVGKPSRNNRARAQVFPIGVDEAKQIVYDRLQIEETGPGYLHFRRSVCNEDFFLQLTAERHVTRYVRGYPTRVWVLRENRRNEVLDMFVLALCSMRILNPSWEQLQRRISARAALDQAPVPDRSDRPTRRITIKRRGSSLPW